ncbi:MAG: nucleotidyltransferase substrate binding protein, partial [Deltaproteobacteria bacterium]|nr:nucleotidyltransferase substrate binding protein [Deltaproteobacteria bacterium]
MHEDIRWKQRFENFEKALSLLRRINEIKEPSEAENMGLIQAFEIAFELSWKCLKDYLEEQGHKINSPRDTIKQAFQSELITEGQLWLEALENRNRTAHLYDETKVAEITDMIRRQYVEL